MSVPLRLVLPVFQASSAVSGRFAEVAPCRLMIFCRAFLLAGFVLAGLLLPPAQADAATLLEPAPSITPDQVVAIQLQALQRNDQPEPDFGIRQTWAFAHPNNRAMTGPLERFAAMIKTGGYEAMINHASHRITQVAAGDGWAQFEVLLEDSRGRVLGFQWMVKKVLDGRFSDCWMTSAVSAPRPAGQGS